MKVLSGYKVYESPVCAAMGGDEQASRELTRSALNNLLCLIAGGDAKKKEQLLQANPVWRDAL